jgi:two-component system, OmpR family, response regulator
VPSPPDAVNPEAPQRRLLVVDDDPDILELLGRYFSGHGFKVSRASDGAVMRTVLACEPIDLVLLDLGLPGEDGLELIRYLRAHWSCAVIVITGRGDAVDRVVGLELGADDYVAKPFDLRELLARVRSVLRRAAANEPAPGIATETQADSATPAIRFDGFSLDPTARRLHAPNGDEIVLTTGEFELLQAFLDQPNRVLSRDSLMNRIHGREAGPYDRAIDVQVGRLRRKLEPDNDPPQLIKAVRGAGYLFAGRVERR